MRTRDGGIRGAVPLHGRPGGLLPGIGDRTFGVGGGAAVEGDGRFRISTLIDAGLGPRLLFLLRACEPLRADVEVLFAARGSAAEE